MAAACSKRYMDLVRTVGGLTPEFPWKPIAAGPFELRADPSPNEYGEWADLAERLTKEMRYHLHVLGAIEELRFQAEPSRGYPKWNEYFEQSNELVARANDLPGSVAILFQGDFSSIVSLKNGIAEATDISLEAVCLMEKVDNAIAAYGGKAPEIATTGHKKPGGEGGGIGLLGTIAVVAVGGVLVWGVVRYARRGDKPAIAAPAEGGA